MNPRAWLRKSLKLFFGLWTLIAMGCCDGPQPRIHGPYHVAKGDAGPEDQRSFDAAGGTDVGFDTGFVDVKKSEAGRRDVEIADRPVVDSADAAAGDVLTEASAADVATEDSTSPDRPVVDLGSCFEQPPCLGCCDLDGDSFYGEPGCGSEVDCDDSDMLIFPGAHEVPQDGVDQDCQDGDLELDETNAVFVSVIVGSDNTGDGSRSSPFGTIGRAEEVAALSGKVIAVGQGRYRESVDLSVSIFGGLDHFTWRRDPSLFQSILETPVTMALVVAENSDLVIHGLTVLGGLGSGSKALFIPEGAGVYALENTFMGHGVDGWVQTIVNHGALLARGNTIVGGFGYSATALVNRGTASATLFHNTIVGGDASNYNFSVYNNGKIELYNNNMAAGDSSEGYGYGVYNYSGELIMVNNSVECSTGVELSSCVAISGGRAMLANNVLVSSGVQGAAALHIWPEGDPQVQIVHNDFYGPQASLLAWREGSDWVEWINDIAMINQCHALWDWCLGSYGNIDDDPIWDTSQHLLLGSPCIDRGVQPSRLSAELATGGLGLDIDGDPRPRNTCWDIGADEH